MTKPSIFTQKLQGVIPCEMVYEDELTFAILDENPLTKGHLLVMPKQEIDHIDDCPPALYEAVFNTVQTLSKQLRKVYSPLRIALVVHGTEVPHAHVHLVPMYTGKELKLADRKPSNSLQREMPKVAQEIRKSMEQVYA